MIPGHIADAASRGDLETIRAYFEDDSDGARDVDDICEEETLETVTLLMLAAGGSHQGLSERSVEVARYLLSRGASVDKRTSETRQTALLLTCYSRGGNVAEMISLLLSAGADPNARNNYHRTPLGAHVRFCGTPSVECVTAMMRAGASLDRVYKEQTFEDQISYRFSVGEEGPDPESSWPKIRALAAGVRRHGSFKALSARTAPRGAGASRTRDAGLPCAEGDASHAKDSAMGGGRRLPRAARRQRRRLERSLVLARDRVNP